MQNTKYKKIALVHDYLSEAGGAERVLLELTKMYPTAPIYTAFVKNGSAKKMFVGKRIVESKWGRILATFRMYSYLRFLLPIVWKSIDLTEYDLVITSCSAYIARGFRVSDKARVVAYCHTPPKWLYGYKTPTMANKKWWGRTFLWIFGPYLRYFDFVSAKRVDSWIANSKEVASRISKFYRRNATIVYPPINISKSEPKAEREDYYLLVCRVVEGKGIEEALRAAKAIGFRLKLVGEMVGGRKMRKLITESGGNVTYLGRVSEGELARLYSSACGFVALATDEDFGMTLVEAMSYGVPVLAVRSGGYKETVIDSKELKTGVFVEDTRVESIKTGISKMEKTKWDHKKISQWASHFGSNNFEKNIRKIVG